MKELSLSDLNIDISSKKISYLDFQLPPEKPPTRMLEGDITNQVSDLVRLLKQESKVL